MKKPVKSKLGQKFLNLIDKIFSKLVKIGEKNKFLGIIVARFFQLYLIAFVVVFFLFILLSTPLAIIGTTIAILMALVITIILLPIFITLKIFCKTFKVNLYFDFNKKLKSLLTKK